MSQRPHLFSIAFVLAAILVAPSIYAQGAKRGGDAHRGPGDLPDFLDSEVSEQLLLDELQEELIQELREEMRGDLEPVLEELGELKSQLEELWSADYPDREAILTEGDWLDLLHSVVRERHVEFRLEVLSILSDEQRITLAELTAEQEPEGERRRRGAGEGREHRELPDQGEQGLLDDDAFDESEDSGEYEDQVSDRSGPQVRRGGGLAEKLDLDELQRAELRALRAAMREETAPVREVMHELRQELKELWSQGWPDEDAIFEVGEDMDTLRSLLREARVDFRLSLMELLTFEQRALLDEDPRQGRRAVVALGVPAGCCSTGSFKTETDEA